MVSRSGALAAQTYATGSAGLVLPATVCFNGSIRPAHDRMPGLQCDVDAGDVHVGIHHQSHDETVQLWHGECQIEQLAENLMMEE